jgi:serine/threonine-protein kinase
MAATDPRRLVAACICAAALSSGTVARAGDDAAAEELFRQARDLMQRGQYDLACPKLAASQELDPGSGTLFNLALCYEHAGKLASAWAAYRRVEADTRTAGQQDRSLVARDRAAVLEPRLAHLQILVDDADARSVTVRRDGKAVPDGEFGAAIPVDSGAHTIEASAPGHVTFRTVVNVADGGSVIVVRVPALEAEPSSPPPPPAMPPQPRSSTARTAATLSFAGASVVTSALGTYFGLLAISKHHDADPYCTGNVCRQPGYDDRRAAVGAGDASTVLFAIGAATLAGAGISFYVLRPHDVPVTARVSMRGLGGGAEVSW